MPDWVPLTPSLAVSTMPISQSARFMPQLGVLGFQQAATIPAENWGHAQHIRSANTSTVANVDSCMAGLRTRQCPEGQVQTLGDQPRPTEVSSCAQQ